MAWEELDYADGRMAGAHSFKVVDAETGDLIPDVIEANAKEGWAVVLTRDERGRKVRHPDLAGFYASERLERPVRIYRPVRDPEIAETKQARAAAKRARQADRLRKGMK